MSIVISVTISLFHYSQSLAFIGDCRRSCNNEYKTCMLSQNMFGSSQVFVQHKLNSFNGYNDKEVRAYMRLPDKSKINSKKIVYTNKEAYIEVIYLINDSDKKYAKKISWDEFCKAARQLCIKKC